MNDTYLISVLYKCNCPPNLRKKKKERKKEIKQGGRIQSRYFLNNWLNFKLVKKLSCIKDIEKENEERKYQQLSLKPT